MIHLKTISSKLTVRLPPFAKTAKGGVATREQDEAAAILGAVRSLPDAYRETLILRLVEGITGP